MRMLFVFAFALLGIADLGPATAADFRITSSINDHAEPLVIYDYEPGVTARAYWLAPWRNQHYFPRTGKMPKLGRVEHLSARTSSIPKPGKYFFRAWSTSSAIEDEGREAQALDNRAEYATQNNRAVHADAEVTILGPDHMTIRLSRKQSGLGANAPVE